MAPPFGERLMARESPESTPANRSADGRGVPIHLSRREVLEAGFLLGAGLLAGCASRTKGPNLVGTPLPSPHLYDHTAEPAFSGGPQDLAALPQGVIPRRTWTNTQPIAALANPMVRIERITVHHDAINSADVTNQAAAKRRLNQIRQSHLERDFADIGYHFIVDPQGNVWEGRPLRFQGAHVKDKNERNMGVMVMGNFMEQTPTPAALASLDAFVASQRHRFGVPMWNVKTHQELAQTLCPGANLQRYMLATRSGTGRMASA